MERFLKRFIIGASLPSFLISFLYIGRGYLKSDDHPVPFQYIAILIPLLMGLYNALAGLVPVGKRLTELAVMIITGFLFGVMLSNIGTWVYDMPGRIFKFSDDRKFIPLVAGPLLYAVIFGIIIYNMNKLFKI